jgi:hypothetical protein
MHAKHLTHGTTVIHLDSSYLSLYTVLSVLLLVLVSRVQIGVDVIYFLVATLTIAVARAIDAYKAASSMLVVVLSLHHSIHLQCERVSLKSTVPLKRKHNFCYIHTLKCCYVL